MTPSACSNTPSRNRAPPDTQQPPQPLSNHDPKLGTRQQRNRIMTYRPRRRLYHSIAIGPRQSIPHAASSLAMTPSWLSRLPAIIRPNHSPDLIPIVLPSTASNATSALPSQPSIASKPISVSVAQPHQQPQNTPRTPYISAHHAKPHNPQQNTHLQPI